MSYIDTIFAYAILFGLAYGIMREALLVMDGKDKDIETTIFFS